MEHESFLSHILAVVIKLESLISCPSTSSGPRSIVRLRKASRYLLTISTDSFPSMSSARDYRNRARAEVMNYIKGQAYKAAVIEMMSLKVPRMHPALRYFLASAREQEAVSEINVRSNKRLSSVRCHVARIKAATESQRALRLELDGYRRYLRNDFLETFAQESEAIADAELDLQRAEEEIALYISGDPDRRDSLDCEEDDLLLKWQLENVNPPTLLPSPHAPSPVSRGNSPRTPPTPSPTFQEDECPVEEY